MSDALNSFMKNLFIVKWSEFVDDVKRFYRATLWINYRNFVQGDYIRKLLKTAVYGVSYTHTHPCTDEDEIRRERADFTIDSP